MPQRDPIDQTTLDALWRDHRRFVSAVLLAHAPRRVDVDDLLQEVAMTFVRAFHTLRDPALLKPWLRTIAINCARSAARRVRLHDRHLRPMLGADSDVVDPAQEKAHRQAESESQAGFVLGVLERLHPDYREPLVLRCVEGMSQKQIAQALSLPETTIETRLARGRRMLRGALAQSLDPRCVRGPYP